MKKGRKEGRKEEDEGRKKEKSLSIHGVIVTRCADSRLSL